MFQFVFVALFVLLLSACESNPPAPVIDRQPQSSKSPTTSASDAPKSNQTSKATTGKDWRPDTYTVKKGDTLFSIGLEYGLEYKEIAAANNISEPYPIQIGQKLNLAGVKAKSEAADTNLTEQNASEDGVVITPIKTDSAVVETTVSENKTSDIKSSETKPLQSAVTPILNEPKAIREPYSLEAFNRSIPVKTTETKVAITGKIVDAKPNETKPVEAKPVENKPTEAKANDAKPADDEAIKWSWPTQGKVVANFNEATNKGIDIGGSTGQAINAASGGKVIYSGSDLRGYGKLVIIKHNKTYLSVYAHNSKILAKEGQIVFAGQKIAEMGNTDSNTVKLHFEIRRLGKSVDPAKYLNQN
jgi:lipoprotein NlpD